MASRAGSSTSEGTKALNALSGGQVIAAIPHLLAPIQFTPVGIWQGPGSDGNLEFAVDTEIAGPIVCKTLTVKAGKRLYAAVNTPLIIRATESIILEESASIDASSTITISGDVNTEGTIDGLKLLGSNSGGAGGGSGGGGGAGGQSGFGVTNVGHLSRGAGWDLATVPDGGAGGVGDGGNGLSGQPGTIGTLSPAWAKLIQSYPVIGTQAYGGVKGGDGGDGFDGGHGDSGGNGGAGGVGGVGGHGGGFLLISAPTIVTYLGAMFKSRGGDGGVGSVGHAGQAGGANGGGGGGSGGGGGAGGFGGIVYVIYGSWLDALNQPVLNPSASIDVSGGSGGLGALGGAGGTGTAGAGGRGGSGGGGHNGGDGIKIPLKGLGFITATST